MRDLGDDVAGGADVMGIAKAEAYDWSETETALLTEIAARLAV